VLALIAVLQLTCKSKARRAMPESSSDTSPANPPRYRFTPGAHWKNTNDVTRGTVTSNAVNLR